MPSTTNARPMLVLASTSRYRRALFDQCGLKYEAMSPGYEEIDQPGESPREQVTRHAAGKARSVAHRLRAEGTDAVVVGSDQGVIVDDQLWGKPGSLQAAIEQLMGLQGREHALYTAVAVIRVATGRAAIGAIEHTMRMRSLDRARIAAYVALDRPVDCAGSYKVEGAGAALFESMRGDDHTGIIGLPITLVGRLARQLGDDWDARMWHRVRPEERT